MKLESVAQVISFDPFSVDTTASETMGLGEAVYMADGRIFRYGSAGGTIAAGNLACAIAPVTNFQNMTTVAAAIGATQITCTPGASTASAHAYEEGIVYVNAGTGLGQTFKIAKQPAISSATAFTLTLFDPIPVALDATSKTSLIANSYNLPVATTTQTNRPSGVPLVALAINNYGWFQTRGVAGVLINGTPAAGSIVVTSASTAGAVDVASSTFGTFLATMPVGKILVTGVSTQYQPVWLQID